MNTLCLSITMACIAMALPLQAVAAQHVYPAKGQSAQQQQSDQRRCDAWATDESGYDPAHPPVPATAKAAPVTGSGARVRGAAVGATVGAIGGNDVGNAAAKGAVVGGIVRRNKNRQAAAQQNEASTQQVQALEGSYWRARKSCLEGRGYKVN